MRGSNAFGEFLRALPEEVARARARGTPIRLSDPGTEHGRQLMLALGVELLPSSARASLPAEWFVERVKPDAYFGRHMDRWKALREEGWELSVLLDRSGRDVVALGFRL